MRRSASSRSPRPSRRQLKAIGTYALVPAVYPKIRQCAVVMKNSPHRGDAEAFLKWMTSDEVQSHMKDFGLTAAE